jgi:1,4-alpha-glucan branching enzyme
MSTVFERPAVGGHDQYLFREGTHARLYEKLGAHRAREGVRFGVWAPNARSVSVVGDFNGWDPRANPLRGSDAGIWEGTVPQAAPGNVYKYHVVSRDGAFRTDKADPFAFRCEIAPKTGSVVWDLDYKWSDAAWMQGSSFLC